MPLLAASRRFLAPLVAVVLALPALAMPFLPLREVSPSENRRLAPAPAWPRTPGDWRALPRRLDAFAADHFAGRDRLIVAEQAARRELGGRRAQQAVVEGHDGWLFLTEGLLQSTGQAHDAAAADDYARFVCQAAERLRRQGARVVFSLAPSPAGVYPEMAPDWAGPARRPTDYDRVIAGVRRCVATVDLRPVLATVKQGGAAYRTTDSHWTARGSLAAFNAAMTGLGREDWRLAASSLAWRRARLSNGDLPRLAGLPPRAELVDIPEILDRDLPRKPLAGLAADRVEPPFEIAGKAGGPSVLVIGDSFTADHFPPYLARHAGRVTWIAQQGCGFDWRVVARARPRYVVILPAERNARCPGGRRPAW